MPSIDQMLDTCRRLVVELEGEPIDSHRLLEIETIIRLLVPHLTRAVADGVHAGKAGALGNSGSALVEIRGCLARIDDGRGRVDSATAQETLTSAAHAARHILTTLEKL